MHEFMLIIHHVACVWSIINAFNQQHYFKHKIIYYLIEITKTKNSKSNLIISPILFKYLKKLSQNLINENEIGISICLNNRCNECLNGKCSHSCLLMWTIIGELLFKRQQCARAISISCKNELARFAKRPTHHRYSWKEPGSYMCG